MGSHEHWVSCRLYGLGTSLVPRGGEHWTWVSGLMVEGSLAAVGVMSAGFPCERGKRGTLSRGAKGKSTLPDRKGQRGWP